MHKRIFSKLKVAADKSKVYKNKEMEEKTYKERQITKICM